MKIWKLALGWISLGSLLTATAVAQVPARQTAPASPAAYEYDNVLTFAPQDKAVSPSDQAPPPPSTGAAKNGKAEEAKEEPKEEENKEEEKKNEPKRLIGEIDHSGINIYGWLQGGITANDANPASHYNGPLAPNDRNEWQFNQVYLVAEKTIDTDKNCWDLGGRVDFLYGTDYIYTQSIGWETKPDATQKWNASKQYGLAIPQLYTEIGHGQLSLKLGHFYTIIGYEVMTPTGNFFYSQNYAVRMMEPTAHWGGLFTWKNSEELSLYLGAVNGQDRLDSDADTCALLTGFAYTPKEKKYAVNFGLMTAGTGPGVGPEGPQTYMSWVLTYNPSEKWQTVTQIDSGWLNNFNGAGAISDAYSLTQYLFYTINDCWKAGLRYDYFVDDQGARLGGLRYGGILPGGNPLPFPSGNAGVVQAATAGLNWTPNNNVRIRPELRWDWYNGTGAPLFDDQKLDRQFTAAVDFIVQY